MNTPWFSVREPRSMVTCPAALGYRVSMVRDQALLPAQCRMNYDIVPYTYDILLIVALRFSKSYRICL